jgi:tetratricopeptide (TPR) repeat protein
MGVARMSGRCFLLSCALILSGLPAAAGTPGLAEALARAQKLLEHGNRSAARSELVLALRSFPSQPLLHNVLGVIEAQDGNYEAAEARFKEAVRADPRYTDAYLNLGRLYQENAARDAGAVPKALAAYEAVLAYDPGHTESLYQSAVLLHATGDFARSRERVSRLPDDKRRRAQVLALWLADEVGAGGRADADRAADTLLDRPDLAEADVVAILPTLTTHGRADLGVRLLERVRARGLASADGLQRLGAAYEAAGRLDAARDALEAAAAVRPDSVALLVDLARVAQSARDLPGALGYLGHARALDPGNARVHFLFGMVCVEMDLGVEAHKALKEAARLDPGNAAINYAMGAVSLHRRDPAEAVPFFRKYAELRPDDPRGPLAVGMAWFKAGDFAAARPELARAAQAPATAAAASYFLARIAREENDGAAALGLVDKALALEPSYADAWAERGLLHLRRRELGAAEQDLRRSLELDPDNYLGNLHLLALYHRAKDARQEAQARRVKELDVAREQKSEEFRRVIEVRPN